MPTYLCRWPNGDVSIVTGEDRFAIDFVLDQVGNADDAELIPIEHAAAVHFRLTEQIEGAEGITECLELESFDERSYSELEKAYPRLQEALQGDGAAGEELSEAIRTEKERLWGCDTVQEIPSDLRTAKLQRVGDLPKSIVEHLKNSARDRS